MTTKNKISPPDASRQIQVVCRDGDDQQLASARMLTGPHVTNANITAYFAKGQFGEMLPIAPLVNALSEASKSVNSNDMKDVEATLMSQATALNMIFGELSRRGAINMGEHLQAAELYLRLALKAQNQCRMTLETLSNIKNPPIIYARQANIANGPQQVNNGVKAPTHATESENPPSKVLETQEIETQSPEQSVASVNVATARSKKSKSKTLTNEPQFEARPRAFIPSKTRFVARPPVAFIPSKTRFVARPPVAFIPSKTRYAPAAFSPKIKDFRARHEQGMDSKAEGATDASNSTLETLETRNGT